MTSPIDAIGAVSGIGGVSGIDGVGAASGTPAATGPNSDFAGMLAKGLQSVQASQNKADDLAIQVANGTLSDPAQYTMAANEASLAMQLTVAIRNKAVEAFQEIMRMQA
ncbi:flagellar hook-basal body complex protein FliE [Krasilnikovia sp. M28-CT-15]|uniref:flagellar hook-basal body complex protein FliE n=1 Tax=Krasilnikovia sp. M28-CT-15 TaxID=3373540 RepID=UPI00399D14DB